MKKSLYVSITLGLTVLSLGAQIGNVTTVLADEVTQETTETTETITTDDHEETSEVSVQDNDAESENKEADESIESGDNSVDDNVNSDADIADNSGNGLKGESSEDVVEAEKDVIDSETDLKETESMTDDLTKDISEEKISDTERIKPLKNADQVVYDNPADHGELWVSYPVRSNKAVYVLDDNGNPIEDVNSDSGYVVKPNTDVYDGETIVASGHLTDNIYYLGGTLDDEIRQQGSMTNKQGYLVSLVNEAKYFLKFENYAYANLDELETYFTKFRETYDMINSAYNDDGTLIAPVTPVIPEVEPIESHSHSNGSHSSGVKSTTNENVDMTVIAIKRANLYRLNGDLVTHRGIELASSWHIDKQATINGQLMYRISNDEWVAASDVQ